MPPLKGLPLKLYLSAIEESIGCLMAQNNVEGHEQVVYYLSRVLSSTETRYTPIEKLCLSLYFACTKLRHYLIKYQVYVVSQIDLMKYMLSRPLDESGNGPLLCPSSPWFIFHINQSMGKL